MALTSTGEMHAFLATPRFGEDGRERDGKIPLVLTEHLREMLRHRMRPGLFGAR